MEKTELFRAEQQRRYAEMQHSRALGATRIAAHQYSTARQERGEVQRTFQQTISELRSSPSKKVCAQQTIHLAGLRSRLEQLRERSVATTRAEQDAEAALRQTTQKLALSTKVLEQSAQQLTAVRARETERTEELLLDEVLETRASIGAAGQGVESTAVRSVGECAPTPNPREHPEGCSVVAEAGTARFSTTGTRAASAPVPLPAAPQSVTNLTSWKRVGGAGVSFEFQPAVGEAPVQIALSGGGERPLSVEIRSDNPRLIRALAAQRQELGAQLSTGGYQVREIRLVRDQLRNQSRKEPQL